jgi:hypothetical protein
VALRIERVDGTTDKLYVGQHTRKQKRMYKTHPHDHLRVTVPQGCRAMLKPFFEECPN